MSTTKSALRKEAMQFRRQLTTEQAAVFNAGLLRRFKALNFSAVRTLHIFLPIEEKQEPDTFAMIEWLNANHPQIKILVPRTDFDTMLMTHHEYTGKADLKKNRFNILEPQQGRMHDGEIDMVIIPLLGFDLNGNRVGYGKGFYDRFLSTVKVGQKIGLSFTGPAEQIADADVHDILLDICITPQKVYRFR